MAVKIAITAYACRAGGGLIQTTNLLRAMNEVAADEQFLMICPANCGYEDIKLSKASQLYLYSEPHTLRPRLKFEFITLPRIVRQYKPDVIFGPANMGLARPPAPQAIYIRNAYFFYDKRHYPDLNLRFRLRLLMLRVQMKQFISASDWVFCQTPVVRKRFSKKYNYPEDKITVLGFPTPEDISLSTCSEPPGVFDRTNRNFYFLVMTHYMPHRNPGLLIPLCRQYGEKLRQKRIKFITTVNPQDSRLSRVFLRDICKWHLEDLIVNVGELSRKEVAAYLDASDVFWLPTLMECLPTSYLEAMSIATPILAPDLDFARYVCDEAAVYYDPWDIDSIFEKIMLLYDDPSLRCKLVEKGKLQLQHSPKLPHNWHEVAATTLEQLRKLAGK